MFILEQKSLKFSESSILNALGYTSVEQNTTEPKNSDIGGHHIAFYVDDIKTAVAYLKEQGVSVQGDVHAMSSGPSAGESWVYFMSPWGM